MTSIATEYGPVKFHYEPKKYKAPHAAAKALHKALCELCADWGGNADLEVLLFTPEQSERNGTGRNWYVCWESGPYEWAYETSWDVANDPHWYTEPYHSFDLCFTR
jgi:hypothetical protein